MANQDFKNLHHRSRGRTSYSKNEGRSMMSGIVIGLIIGVGISIGLVMYLNKFPTDFSNLRKLDRNTGNVADSPLELLDPGSRLISPTPGNVASAPPPDQQPMPAGASGSVAQDPLEGKEEKRFDFYRILPGQFDAALKKQSTTSESLVQQPGNAVFLQLGAFQHLKEADKLKAKLALLGVEASIQSTTVPGNGLVYRVRGGPYSQRDEAARIKAQLQQDGIGSSIVQTE